MIDIIPCRGCGRPLIHHRVANLTVRLETEPLDGSAAVGEIIAQRPLWMVDSQGKVRPARPGEAGPLREHRCTESAQAALSRPRSTPEVQGDPKALTGRPAGQQTPSSGPSAATPSVQSVDHALTRVDGPRCDGCGEPCADGTYASIQVGELTVWAIHVESCGRG